MEIKDAWEQEYAEKRFMTGDKPPKSVLKFVKFLKKKDVDLDGSYVLDLGSGEGKNAFYMAGLGAQVNCVEIAQNAVQTTKKRAAEANLSIDRGLSSVSSVPPRGEVSDQCRPYVNVQQGSIGEKFDFSDNTFDVILDVTSSNSLAESERQIYLSESARVLRPSGHMFVRALCKDADDNAKYLLKKYPGKEVDTYVQPGWGLIERVFTESDLRELYGQYFNIVHLERETHYTTFENRKYKRNFWVVYLSSKNL